MHGGRKPLCLLGVAAILLVTTWSSGAQAQFLSRQLEEADSYRLFYNPSPRLAGMGLLGIAVEDENNEINLFDYIKSPAGLLADRDSTSIDFQFDYARNRTDWKGVDPLAYSPVGPLWPSFLDFGSADLQTRFRYSRYDLLAAYRDPNNLSIAVRAQHIRSSFAHDVTKYDVTYITALGEEDEAVPETLFVGAATRDSISDARSWIFDIMADKEVTPGFHVAGHGVFSFEDETPNILHGPDSLTIEMTRPVIVDVSTEPNGASRRRQMPVTAGDGRGAGTGVAFSYEVGDHVTLGTSGDVLSTRETIRIGGPFFRQELTRNYLLLTGKVHSLFKLGRALEGAVKHQSENMSGDGRYFWSFGCPLQGGGYDPYTVGGPIADRDGWEERTGTRWLIRVPETSIKLSVEYESARGALKIKPAASYSADVFVVPGDCGGGGGNEPLFPRYAVVVDDVPLTLNFDERNFISGASLTLWFGRRPVTLAAEYQDWSKDTREASGWSLDRNLSLIKVGSEVGATRKITMRAGGLWGREEMAQEGVWNEGTLTLGGTYVLTPGLRQVEVAYMYRSRKPDFGDIYHRETSEHRVTAYTRIYF